MYLDLTVNLTYTVPNDCIVCVYQVLSWVLFYYAYFIHIYPIKYLPRVRSGYSMCRQLSWRCCLAWPRRAPMRSCSQCSAVAECRSKTLLTEGSVDFQGCAQPEQHDGRERAQRHQQAAPHVVEPLANCAAQGELEHQGGLRARRSRGGKTLNLAI